jgi:hypothetical protein
MGRQVSMSGARVPRARTRRKDEAMRTATFGFMMGLGLALAAGPALAETGGTPTTGTTMHTTTPAGTGNAMAKNGKSNSDAGTDKAMPGKAMTGKMMCEEFLSLDEVTKPKVVYWAEGFTKKGKPQDAVFDVEATERLVPTLVEVCQKEPKSSFMTKVKNESSKKSK